MINGNEIDKHLFQKIKKGDEKAFDELFNKYYRHLCEFSNLIIQNKSCAEEVVADVFANIWINRKKINLTGALRSYLFQSTKNTTISYLRKKKIQFETYQDEQVANTKANMQPDKRLILLENKLKIEKLLDVLPQRNREIFELHRFSGLKYIEIADVMDISVKTVEKHMSKALKLLREKYQKKSQII